MFNVTVAQSVVEEILESIIAAVVVDPVLESAETSTDDTVRSVIPELELCADELVVGGGVGWSYDRRRRRRRRQTG